MLDAWFEGAATDPTRGYTKGDFLEHVQNEHSTFRWLFEPVLEAAGLAIEDVEFGGRVYGEFTCTKR